MKKSSTTDKLVLTLFATVKQKQQEIANSEKPHWETTCTVGFNPDTVNDRINIQTTTSISKLIDIYSFLLIKEDFWQKSVRELDVTEPFKWMGFGLNAWKKDIKSRIEQINLNVKKKELADLEDRLNNLITVEQRRELELAEIAKLLG